MCIRDRISDLSIEDVDFKGFNPLIGDFLPEEIDLTFRVEVENPTDYEAEVTNLQYQVYIENNFLGEGETYGIFLPPRSTSPVHISFRTTSEDVIEIIADVLRRGDRIIDFTVKGVATVPVKFFNVMTISNIQVPFERSGYYTLSIPGMKANATGFNACWSSTTAVVGKPVKAIVEVKGPASGTLKIVIMKDVPLLSDKPVYHRELSISVPFGTESFEISFVPEEPSGATLRGYYIVVYLSLIHI